MGLYQTLKRNARHAMSGAWGRAILILALVTLPTVSSNILEEFLRDICGLSVGLSVQWTIPKAIMAVALSIVLAVFIFLVTTPLQQGSTRWFYRRTGGENDSIGSIFYYFETAKEYFKAVWLHFQIALRVLLVTLVLSIPYVAIFLLMFLPAFEEQPKKFPVEPIAFLLLFIWIILFLILITMFTLRYFLASYLLVEFPEKKASELIRRSVQLMKGNKAKVFLFGLSFLGWWIPSFLILIFIMGIPFSGIFYTFAAIGFSCLAVLAQLGLCIYAVPYMQAAFAMYARYLIHVQTNSEFESRNDYADSTREYQSKPDIDQYMKQE